jgi:hypothetical protein
MEAMETMEFNYVSHRDPVDTVSFAEDVLEVVGQQQRGSGHRRTERQRRLGEAKSPVKRRPRGEEAEGMLRPMGRGRRQHRAWVG